MATKKYRITLEIECDSDERIEGSMLNLPMAWDFNSLLSKGGFHVTATVTEGFEDCCESFTEWLTTPADDRYPQNWMPFFHDEECEHFQTVEDVA